MKELALDHFVMFTCDWHEDEKCADVQRDERSVEIHPTEALFGYFFLPVRFHRFDHQNSKWNKQVKN